MNTIPQAIRTLLEELQTDTAQDRAERIGQVLAQYPDPAPAPVITAQTPIDYGNNTIREHAEHLVRNEVYYCISSLVSSLQSEDACSALDIDFDDVLNVCRQDDWETPVTEYLQSSDSETVADVAEYFDVETDPELPDLCTALIAHLDGHDSWQEAGGYCRLDPDTVEAYEHWLVSEWLSQRLEEMGEMVSRDLLGLTIWGRACTGQSLSMDNVMLTIARDNLIRD